MKVNGDKLDTQPAPALTRGQRAEAAAGRKASRRISPRDALAFLLEQYSLSAAGSGRLVLIQGGMASGKTQLLNELLNFAAESGALTLSATGAPDEQRLSAGIVDQLFTNSGMPPEVTDRVAAALAPAHAGRLDDATPPWHTTPAFATVVQEICRTILRFARERPMVIGVDDLQFADDGSLRLLLQLQRRIRSTRLLIVLNQWDRSNPADRQLHAYFTKLPHHHIQLAPMCERSIRDLVAEVMDGPVSEDLPARLRQLSGGNPMLVNALVDDCRADYRAGCRTGQPVVGPAYAHAVLTFLRHWGSPLPEVAGALAILGDQGNPDLVAPLAGVSCGLATEMMGVLTEVGLLAGGRFRHPQAEAATLESLSPAVRSQLHLRAAELKHHRAEPADEVAAHLVAAGHVAAGWPIRVLREAADQALLDDNVGFARECLELALSASTDAAQRRAILNSLARTTWRINPSATMSYLTALQQSVPEGAAHHADPIALARHALWHGDEAAFSAALDALAGSPDLADAQTAAQIRLATQWHFGPGNIWTDGNDKPSRQTDPWHHTATTLARVWVVGRSDATTASAERILRNCHLDDTTLEALATAILALAYDNRGERADYWCAVLSEQAARRSAVTWQAMLDGVWATVILRRGDVPNAVARARASLDLLGPRSWGVSVSYPLTTLLAADTATGSFDTAANLLRYPVPDAMFRTVGGLRFLRARGRYHLATDRVLAAISDFQECRRLMDKLNMDLPALVPWRSDLAEANLRLGNVGIARELAKQQLERSAETDAYSRGCALRILALVSPPADRPVLLAQATEYLKKSGDRLEISRILKVAGQQHQLARRLETVQTARVAQQRTLRPVPTRPPEPPAAPLLRPASELAGPTEPNVLSMAELRVAQLAALGQTNRQIGNSLFITVSTVEQHLTRVYRKLGIRGRNELPTGLTSTA